MLENAIDTDTFGPQGAASQPEPLVHAGLLAVIFEYREKAEQRGAARAKGRPNLALTATLNEMELRIDECLTAEREAHAAIRTELEHLQAALSKSEGLPNKWRNQAVEHYRLPTEIKALLRDCASELEQALATAQTPPTTPTPGAYLITDAQLTDLMQAAELLTCASEEPQAQQARELVRGVVQAARKVGG